MVHFYEHICAIRVTVGWWLGVGCMITFSFETASIAAAVGNLIVIGRQLDGYHSAAYNRLPLLNYQIFLTIFANEKQNI